MTSKEEAKYIKLALIALGLVLVAGLASVGWWWKEQQKMNELVSPGLILINYTDHAVYASVHYNKSPDPEDGASDRVRPHAGGGSLVCCVTIPLRWRPGIKMSVWYSTKDWKKEDGQTKIIELPPYPNGDAADLILSFLPDETIELFSSRYAPGHPKWPGKMKGYPGEVLDSGEPR
jgi:hypothetical protein